MAGQLLPPSHLNRVLWSQSRHQNMLQTTLVASYVSVPKNRDTVGLKPAKSVEAEIVVHTSQLVLLSAQLMKSMISTQTNDRREIG